MGNIAFFHSNLNGLVEPLRIKGLVQAGSTADIQVGELCTWDETSGYWIPISAAGDAELYQLAFCDEEISTLTAPAARYAMFVVPRPEDVFAIELAAAAAVTLGANYVATGTNSQTATVDADGLPIFNSVGDANYPIAAKYGGTTVVSESHGLFTMNPEFSYYKKLVPLAGAYKKVLTIGAATTLKEEWSGAIVHNIGATAAYEVELPQNCRIGTHFYFVSGDTDDLRVHSTGGGIYIKSGKQADSKYIGLADINDFMQIVHIGENDWLAFGSMVSSETAIVVET